MQLLEGTIPSPINVKPDETPSARARTTSTMLSSSSLNDLSQLEMVQPIDRQLPSVPVWNGQNQTAVFPKVATTALRCTSSDTDGISAPQTPQMAPNIYSISEQLAIATVLPTRTTEGVIADLQVKRLRPASPHIPFMPSKRRQSSVVSTAFQDLKPIVTKYAPEWVVEIGAEQAEDGSMDEDDEGDDYVVPSTKPGKISERKRRQNAIADGHIQNTLQKSFKQGSRVKPEDEALQSARWLINQSESHQIISTPRAYQTELFEKAKEKNIIAVLDTGSGKTLIAVLLLRHTFNQELEARAMGKAKRISFFSG